MMMPLPSHVDRFVVPCGPSLFRASRGLSGDAGQAVPTRKDFVGALAELARNTLTRSRRTDQTHTAREAGEWSPPSRTMHRHLSVRTGHTGGSRCYIAWTPCSPPSRATD